VIYIVATPQNQLDKKGRPTGWQAVPLNKKAKQEWRGMLKQLTEGRGIEKVVASDLDGEAAHAAAEELRVPVKTDYIYRRFNIGKFHARNEDAVNDALRKAEEKWKTRPEIPVREGDSLISYQKRFVRAFNSLLEMEGTFLFITDKQSIAMIRAEFDPHCLVPNGNPVRADRLFRVQHAGT
jgi:broad specificity phosphatase PhoE